MKYFRLEPDVILVPGKAGGALYRLGEPAVTALSSRDTAAVRHCDSGTPVERLSVDLGGSIPVLARLAHAGVGRFFDRWTCVDSYRHTAPLRGQDLEERPIALEAVHLQLSADCRLRCRGCGDHSTRVWQGCNSCDRWPRTHGSQLTASGVSTLVSELGQVPVARVFLAGGDCLAHSGLVEQFVAGIYERSVHTMIVVTTNGVSFDIELARRLSPKNVSFNIVHLAAGREECAAVCGEAEAFDRAWAATDACQRSHLKFYVTLRLSPDSEFDAATWTALVRERCMPIGVLTAQPVVFATEEAKAQRPPVRAAWKQGPARLSAPGPAVWASRRRFNPCLDRALAFAADGSVRPCPMIDATLAPLEPGVLRSMFDERRHEPYWEMTKDRIATCASCEFRYACTDCTAIDLCREQLSAQASLCEYDPQTSGWRHPTTTGRSRPPGIGQSLVPGPADGRSVT